MADCSIQEPFLLQSYSNSRQFEKSKALVYASSSNNAGYVAVAAQGDGIHILDVASLHVIISHTLGPSTTFSCPPITLHNEQFTTYAAIATSSDLPQEAANRTIWSWKDTLAVAGNKQSATLSHDIQSLHDLSPWLVAVSAQGSVSIFDSKLQIVKTLTPTSSEFKVTKSFCFHAKDCTFLFSGTGTLLLVETSKTSSRIRTLSIGNDISLQDLGTCAVMPNIVDAACDASGFLTALSSSNELQSYQLRQPSTGSNVELATLSPPVQLVSLTSVSILALSSSFVLLAGIHLQKMTLLVWDMRFSVVLATHALDLPDDSQVKTTTFSLCGSSQSEAILIVSPIPKKTDSKSLSRSSIFIVPTIVPKSSTIAAAMGRAASTAAWLKQDTTANGLEGAQQKLISEIQSALEQQRPQNASQAFFAWEQQAKKSEGSVSMGYQFVKELLNVSLQVGKPAKHPYSSDIVRHLLKLGVVSASMIDSGFLSTLRLRDDWTSIQLSLKRVSDLLEVEIIDCLRYVISRGDAMDVDGASPDAPTLQEFLRLCVRYTSSPVALRSALRRCLSEAADITRVLETLDTWIGQWSGRTLPLISSQKAEKNAQGVYIAKAITAKSDEMPSMDKIVTFITAIMDSSLLVLLQHPPAHRALRRITAKIDREIRSVDQTEQLRGPLETFVKAQIKSTKAAEQGNDQMADWRQRSKLAHEAAAGAIGVYQVERLVLL